MFLLRNLFFLVLISMVGMHLNGSVYSISVYFQGYDTAENRGEILGAIQQTLNKFKKDKKDYTEKEKEFANKSRFWNIPKGSYRVYTDAYQEEIETALKNLNIDGLQFEFVTEVK